MANIKVIGYSSIDNHPIGEVTITSASGMQHTIRRHLTASEISGRKPEPKENTSLRVVQRPTLSLVKA